MFTDPNSDSYETIGKTENADEITTTHDGMNTTLPLMRFLFLIACALAAAADAKAAGYSYTRIADSTGPLADFDFASPSLSETGTVAFLGRWDNGNRGVFSGAGGLLTTIATTPLQFASFGDPAINDAGTVAFVAFNWNGVGGDRIYVGNGGSLVTIADTAGPLSGFAGGYSTAINTAGTVAFWASQDAGPSGIFQNSGGTIISTLINSASFGSGFSISLNDAGTLAFRGAKDGRVGIFSFSAGTATTIYDTLGPFNYFGSAPSINDAGTVAFNAGVAGIDGGVFGIYTGNGGALTTIADLAGPFSSLGDFNFTQPSINDVGTVAFAAALDAGGGGIFIGDGTTSSLVLDATAPFLGSTLTGLGISPTSLNNAGQVAFYYELANGTTGIAIATPVPEPGTLSLLLGGLLASLGPRRRTRLLQCSLPKLSKMFALSVLATILATAISRATPLVTFEVRAVSNGIGVTAQSYSAVISSDGHSVLMAPGGFVVLQLLATLNAQNGDLTDDGFTRTTGSFITVGTGGTMTGSLQGDGSTVAGINNVNPFRGVGARSGASAELSGTRPFNSNDGILDVGASATNTFTGYFTASSNNPAGNVGQSFILGETGLWHDGGGGSTSVGFFPRLGVGGLSGNRANVVFRIDNINYALNGDGSGIGGAADAFAFQSVEINRFPEPTSFGMLLLGSATLAGFHRLDSVKRVRSLTTPNR